MALADCDEALAKRDAKFAFDDMNANDEGYEAIVRAVTIGADAPVHAWIDGLQSDSRSHAISALGKSCKDSEEVQAFFIGRSETLGKEFWDQRWYKGLSNCGVDPIENLLWGQLSSGVNGDYTLFYGVLEAYARCAAGDAVPKIKELLDGAEDAEMQSNLMIALGDASQLGSVDGPNAKIMSDAVEVILSAQERLKPQALKQARQSLLALDAEKASDELAAIYHKDLIQGDGDFMWGVISVETATCKNGKMKQRVQLATVSESGNTWGDQFQERVEASIRARWTLDLAERCKGTGEVQTLVPSQPFKDKAAYKEWVEAQLKEIQRADIPKLIRVDNDALAI